MENTEVLQTLLQIIEDYQNAEGWTDLALIGKPLSTSNVNYKSLGYSKLKGLIEDFPDDLELRKDSTHGVPVMYVRAITSSDLPYSPPLVEKKSDLPARKPVTITSKLTEWAYIRDFAQVIQSLSDMVLPERWYFKSQNTAYPNPVLANYLSCTFSRLTKEMEKIAITDRYATFDTGLVNHFYDPVYALFEKNKNTGRQDWFFLDFCAANTGKSGKILTSAFDLLPERAQYFYHPSELFYDFTAPELQVNWNQLILDNLSHLPVEFLEENKPSGFEMKDTSAMNIMEKYNYFESMATAIENDGRRLRSIKNRFSDSLSLALKKVRWNFRTAVPMYHPASNKVLLLLPLSFMDDEIVDLALVMDKALPSGSYIGHTVIPLSWAYNNARLITRPNSDWLIPEQIETNEVEEP